MAVRQLTVSHIILTKFDITSERCTVEISFKEDTPFLYSFTLSSDFSGIVERLLSDLKRAKTSSPGARDDDILAGYNPVYLLRSEHDPRFEAEWYEYVYYLRVYQVQIERYYYFSERILLPVIPNYPDIQLP